MCVYTCRCIHDLSIFSVVHAQYNRVNVMAAEIVKLPPMLIHAKGESWRRARKTLSPAFSAMKMKMVCRFHLDEILSKFGVESVSTV